MAATKTKVLVYYKDGSMTKITCWTVKAERYVKEYIGKSSVIKLTSQEYPFKSNALIVHKDLESEATK